MKKHSFYCTLLNDAVVSVKEVYNLKMHNTNINFKGFEVTSEKV